MVKEEYRSRLRRVSINYLKQGYSVWRKARVNRYCHTLALIMDGEEGKVKCDICEWCHGNYCMEMNEWLRVLV